MSFNPPDYYSQNDFPLVKKRIRTKRIKKPHLNVGDRIMIISINIPKDGTDLRPSDKGTVDEIIKTSTDYEIYVVWDKGYGKSDNFLFASEDKWKIIKHAK